jgi:hypothetical protein
MSSSNDKGKDPIEESLKKMNPEDEVRATISSKITGEQELDKNMSGESSEEMEQSVGGKPKPEILKAEKVVGKEEGHSFKAETMYGPKHVFCDLCSCTCLQKHPSDIYRSDAV